MDRLKIVVDGIDGSGKSTLVRNLRKMHPALAVDDRGTLTPYSNKFPLDLYSDVPRETSSDGKRIVYIVLDISVDEASNRIMKRFNEFGTSIEKWETKKYLHYYRFVYSMMAAKYGLYLIEAEGMNPEQVLEEASMIVNEERKGKQCFRWLVPDIDVLKETDVATMSVVAQGWSKIIRSFDWTDRFHILELIPSVYSHTNQSAGIVPGTDLERRRMANMSLLLFWLNEIDTTWVYVGKKYILVRALSNAFNSDQPDITDIECIWKRMYGGTDKHRYWDLLQRKTRTGEPVVHPTMDGHYLEYIEPYFRCDLRNPNHVFKLPRDPSEIAERFELNDDQVRKVYDRVEWYRGEDCPDALELSTMLGIKGVLAEEIVAWLCKNCNAPWGDYNMAPMLANYFIDHEKAEALTLKIGKVVSDLAQPSGMVFLDFCVMITSDGRRVYGEFSQDCCRVDQMDEDGKPMSLTKDVWRAGGSHPDKSLLLSRYREMSDVFEKALRKVHHNAIDSVFPSKSSVTVVVGGQIADEGKAKVVSLVSKRGDVLYLRVNASTNATHNTVIEVNGKTQRILSRQLPSFFFSSVEDKERLVLSPGAIFNMEDFVREIRNRPDAAVLKNKIYVAGTICLILPHYLTRSRSSFKTETVGTTQQGTGVAMTARTARHAIRLNDIVHYSSHSREEDEENSLPEKIKRSFKECCGITVSHQDISQCCTDLVSQYLDLIKLIGDFVVDYSSFMWDHRDADVIIEGCNGAMIDNVFGMVPFVTSCSTTLPAMLTYANRSPFELKKAIIVCGAYVCCVNKRPFPTEICDDAVLQKIRCRGLINEVDETDYLPRRLGWLDLPMLRKTLFGASGSSVIFNKLDVLCDVGDVKVCTEYVIDGDKVSIIPDDEVCIRRAVPKYRVFDGWSAIEDRECVVFRQFLSDFVAGLNCKLMAFGTGPKGSDFLIL